MISRASGVLLIRGACAHSTFKQDACKYKDAEKARASVPEFADGTSQRGIFGLPMLQRSRSVFANAASMANLREASERIARMQEFPLKKLQVIHALSPDSPSVLVSPRLHQGCKDRGVD